MGDIKPKKIEVLPLAEPQQEQIIPTVTPVHVEIETLDLKKIIDEELEVDTPKKVTICLEDVVKEFSNIATLEDLEQCLAKLLVKFDTAPRKYTKKDYDYLMWLIGSALIHLYGLSPESVVTNEWHDPLREDLVPSEKLTKETIDTVEAEVQQEVIDRTNAVNGLLPLIFAAY